VFDTMRAGLLADRAQFIANLGPALYGPAVSQAILDWSFALAMQTSIKACHDCVQAFSETDFRLDLQAFDVPTLVMHGEYDQIAPPALTAQASAGAIPGAELLIYPGAPHGLFLTHKSRVNADLLRFIRA
jgi:non-heme chloroperoxidase